MHVRYNNYTYIIDRIIQLALMRLSLTWLGSLFRQEATNSLKGREKFPVSSGGVFRGIMKRTFIGWRSALGGSPLASSIAVIPRDQISAFRREY